MSIRTIEQQTEHILGRLHTERARRRERRKRTLRAAAALASFVIVCGVAWSFFGYYGNLMQKNDGYSGGAVQDGVYNDKPYEGCDKSSGNGTAPSDFDCNSAPAPDMAKNSDMAEEPPDSWDMDTSDNRSYAVCEEVYLKNLLGENDKLTQTVSLFAADGKKLRLTTRRSGSSLTFSIGENSLQISEGRLSEYLESLGERSTLTVTGLPYTSSPEDGLAAAVTASVEKMTVSEEQGEILLTVQLEKVVFSEKKPFFFLLRFWNTETPGEQLLGYVCGRYLPG